MKRRIAPPVRYQQAALRQPATHQRCAPAASAERSAAAPPGRGASPPPAAVGARRRCAAGPPPPFALPHLKFLASSATNLVHIHASVELLFLVGNLPHSCLAVRTRDKRKITSYAEGGGRSSSSTSRFSE